MRVAVLINRRQDRESISARIGGADVSVAQYATAAQALDVMARECFDLIVMEGKVFPGFGCSDAAIRELAELLPDSRHMENLLYWQVGLRVIEVIRSAQSSRAATQVIVRFPELRNYQFDAGDELTRDSVESDLEDKGPVTPCFGMTMSAFIDHVGDLVEELKG